MNAIVAEANGVIRTSIRIALEAFDFDHVLEVSDSRELGTALRFPALAVIIADCDFPGMPAAELIERVHEVSSELPVVFLTNTTKKEAVLALGELGAAGVVIKPFDRDRLFAAVVSAMNRRTPPTDDGRPAEEDGNALGGSVTAAGTKAESSKPVAAVATGLGLFDPGRPPREPSSSPGDSRTLPHLQDSMRVCLKDDPFHNDAA